MSRPSDPLGRKMIAAPGKEPREGWCVAGTCFFAREMKQGSERPQQCRDGGRIPDALSDDRLGWLATGRERPVDEVDGLRTETTRRDIRVCSFRLSCKTVRMEKIPLPLQR